MQQWLYRYRREGLTAWRRSNVAITVNPRSAPPCRSGSWPPSGRTRVARSTCCGSCWRTKAWYRGVRCRVRAIHRFLQRQGLSRPVGRRQSTPRNGASFLAEQANQIWFGDVMHGPPGARAGSIAQNVSSLAPGRCLAPDRAQRVLPAETALEIEGVLKQGVLKRGIAQKLIVDNGSAYRSASLQGICARLSISLIFCRPYAPEGKGKLERWHRTLRTQFLSELHLGPALGLEDLNARLWAWVESGLPSDPARRPRWSYAARALPAGSASHPPVGTARRETRCDLPTSHPAPGA